MRRFCSAALVLACWLSSPHPGLFAQNIHFHALDQATLEQRLQLSPKTNELRQESVEQLFSESGCTATEITRQPVKHQNFSNVLCTISGESDRTILVTAHYDKVSVGDGTVDNWSGAALLASLHQSLQGIPHKHRIVFISFCCEEEGLLGSQSFVDGLSKDDATKISAIVNMDTLGLSPTKLWASKADKHLSQILLAAAQTMNLPLSVVDVDRVGSTDSESFEKLKVPRMTLHSVTQQTLHILHSSDDQIKAIHMDDYYQTYKLMAGFISLLDSTLDATPPAAAPAK
jgi:putative aminopeptidase FrvX